MTNVLKFTRALRPAEAARRMRVTIKALRHYEKCGLLKPGRAPNGWRVYEREQLERLERILALKAMGFGLSQIAILLNAEPDAFADALAAQELHLEREAGKIDQALEVVRETQRKSAPERVEKTRLLVLAA